MKSTPNIFRIFKQFKKKCNAEFLNAIFVSFSTSCMIDRYYWQSDKVKEKVSLGVMLSDITLSGNDFERLSEHNGPWNELPGKIFRHPLETVEKIQKFTALQGKELQEVIEFHHEMPDGSGYPRGLDHRRIPLLACVHIVARHFVEDLMAIEFDFKRRDELMAKLYVKFNKGHFKSALFTIYEFLNIEKPE